MIIIGISGILISPYNIASKFLAGVLCREGRKGIDVVNDNVENSLMREVDNIKVREVVYNISLKGQCHEIFLSVILMNQTGLLH